MFTPPGNVRPSVRHYMFIALQFMVALMILIGGFFGLRGDNKLLAVGMIGVGAAGTIDIVRRWISPEPFPIAECDGQGSTLLLASRTRRTLSFTILTLLTGGACLIGGFQLAFAGDYFWAFVIGFFGAWIIVGWRYYFSGRLAGGAIRLTPKSISQHIDNREQGIDWSNIDSITPTFRRGRLALSLNARHPSQVMRAQHASRIFGFRSWPAAKVVELQTSRMTVIQLDELTRVVDGYLTNPPARQRLGTPASIRDIDDFIKFRFIGGPR